MLPNRIHLPAPLDSSIVSIEQVLLSRRSVREFSARPLEFSHVSQLAWAAQGISGPDHRTAPSAGALYPLNVCLAAGKVLHLRSGIYNYDSQNHDLMLVFEGDKRRELSEAALSQTSILDAAAVFAISAVYKRTTSKYGERGIRYVHMEAGHSAQNLLLQAAALGLGSVLVGAFSDDRVREVLMLNADEAPLYLIPVGKP
ncbi:MAG TPA: SagB/ThcOx family dehydrogenase [Candidatus Binatia bacterium]|jgi:SagB-type dehydrogenase family enzyme